MFYELALEVCSNQEKKPIELLAQALFELPYVKGPLSRQSMEPTVLEPQHLEHTGYLILGKEEIPFILFFISEEAKGGSNWLDIGVYATMNEKEDGSGSFSVEEGKGLKNLFLKIAQWLYSIYPFRLGLIGYEVSGVYSLEWLKEQEISEEEASRTTFIINRRERVKEKNQQWMTLVE